MPVRLLSARPVMREVLHFQLTDHTDYIISMTGTGMETTIIFLDRTLHFVKHVTA
jgi:hypothetical protein